MLDLRGEIAEVVGGTLAVGIVKSKTGDMIRAMRFSNRHLCFQNRLSVALCTSPYFGCIAVILFKLILDFNFKFNL
jgi:hypothetical protein